MTRDVLDCRSCGACCVAFDGVVPVYVDDVTPRHLTRSVRRVIGFGVDEADEGTRRMASAGGRCIALRGEAGKACRCGVYDRRPSGCRVFEVGGVECLRVRSEFGMGG